MPSRNRKEEQPSDTTGSEGYTRGSMTITSFSVEIPYRCPWEGCDYKTTRVDNLAVHIEDHHHRVRIRLSQVSS